MATLDYLDIHPFVRTTVADKAIGIVEGAALGDCIGLYTEFLPRSEALQSYPEQKFLLSVTEPRGDSHRDKFLSGSWTDDTDHALLLILSYLHNSHWELPANNKEFIADFASRLRLWCTQGLRCLDRPPLGIGATIHSVVVHGLFLENPKAVAMGKWLNSAHNRRPAANGSLMRTHPLGMISVGFKEEDSFELAAALGEVTHADLRCVLSCVIVTGLLRGMLRGEVSSETDINELIQRADAFVKARPRDDRFGEPVDSLIHSEELDRYLAATNFAELELSDRQSMGYVYKCLGASVLTLRKGMAADIFENDTFEGLITELVMQGGDADTNACVAGALLGAWLGASRLPRQWKTGMRDYEWLHLNAKRFSQRVGISQGSDESPKGDSSYTAPDGGRGFLNQDELNKMEKEIVVRTLEKSRKRRETERLEKEEQSKTTWFGLRRVTRT